MKGREIYLDNAFSGGAFFTDVDYKAPETHSAFMLNMRSKGNTVYPRKGVDWKRLLLKDSQDNLFLISQDKAHLVGEFKGDAVLLAYCYSYEKDDFGWVLFILDGGTYAVKMRTQMLHHESPSIKVSGDYNGSFVYKDGVVIRFGGLSSSTFYTVFVNFKTILPSSQYDYSIVYSDAEDREVGDGKDEGGYLVGAYGNTGLMMRGSRLINSLPAIPGNEEHIAMFNHEFVHEFNVAGSDDEGEAKKYVKITNDIAEFDRNVLAVAVGVETFFVFLEDGSVYEGKYQESEYGQSTLFDFRTIGKVDAIAGKRAYVVVDDKVFFYSKTGRIYSINYKEGYEAREVATIDLGYGKDRFVEGNKNTIGHYNKIDNTACFCIGRKEPETGFSLGRFDKLDESYYFPRIIGDTKHNEEKEFDTSIVKQNSFDALAPAICYDISNGNVYVDTGKPYMSNYGKFFLMNGYYTNRYKEDVESNVIPYFEEVEVDGHTYPISVGVIGIGKENATRDKLYYMWKYGENENFISQGYYPQYFYIKSTALGSPFIKKQFRGFSLGGRMSEREHANQSDFQVLFVVDGDTVYKDENAMKRKLDFEGDGFFKYNIGPGMIRRKGRVGKLIISGHAGGSSGNVEGPMFSDLSFLVNRDYVGYSYADSRVNRGAGAMADDAK